MITKVHLEQLALNWFQETGWLFLSDREMAQFAAQENVQVVGV